MLYLELDIETTFDGKAIKFNETCSCTTGFVEKTSGKSYKLKVNIDKAEEGDHTISFSTTFSRDNLAGRPAMIDLFMKVKFKKG